MFLWKCDSNKGIVDVDSCLQTPVQLARTSKFVVFSWLETILIRVEGPHKLEDYEFRLHVTKQSEIIVYAGTTELSMCYDMTVQEEWIQIVYSLTFH